MADTERVEELIKGVLVPGESVQFAAVSQVKQGKKAQLQRAGTTAVASAAATAAASAALGGVGVMVVKLPPAVWTVVTNHRLLLINRTKGVRAGAGAVVFDAPRVALRGSLKSSLGLLREVTITDADDGDSLVRLNFGAKKDAAKTVVDALGA
jgi:hypothetical protein